MRLCDEGVSWWWSTRQRQGFCLELAASTTARSAWLPVTLTPNVCIRTHRQGAGVPGWVCPEELIAPLRAINGLTIELAPEQAHSAVNLAAKARQEAGLPPEESTASGLGMDEGAPGTPHHHDHNHDHHDHHHHHHHDTPGEAASAGPQGGAGPSGRPVGGDAEAGLMALWGLLNLSGYPAAQVSICRHGLYTLLRAVHR